MQFFMIISEVFLFGWNMFLVSVSELIMDLLRFALLIMTAFLISPLYLLFALELTLAFHWCHEECYAKIYYKDSEYDESRKAVWVSRWPNNNVSGIKIWSSSVDFFSHISYSILFYISFNNYNKIKKMLRGLCFYVWQIENEYGPLENEFGAPGKAYTKWAAEMAVGLGTGVPWVMCKQNDAPDPVVSVSWCCDMFSLCGVSI